MKKLKQLFKAIIDFIVEFERFQDRRIEGYRL